MTMQLVPSFREGGVRVVRGGVHSSGPVQWKMGMNDTVRMKLVVVMDWLYELKVFNFDLKKLFLIGLVLSILFYEFSNDLSMNHI